MPIVNIPLSFLISFFCLFSTTIQSSPNTLSPLLRQTLLNEFQAVHYRPILPVPLNITPPHDAQAMYRIIYGPYAFYLSEEGFSMRGNLIDIEQYVAPNDTQRIRLIKEALTALDPEKLLIFPPKHKKRHSITIFTDSTCPYSAALHHEIDLLTDAGVEVRYLAFPRYGIDSLSYPEMQAIWCHAQPYDAFNMAIEQQFMPDFVDDKACASSIDSNMLLGNALGIIGTPTLLFENGFVSTGYSSAIDILDYLDKGVPLQAAEFSIIGEDDTLLSTQIHLPSQDMITPSAAALSTLKHNLIELNLIKIDLEKLTFSQKQTLFSTEIGSYLIQVSMDGQYLFRANLLEEYQIKDKAELARIRRYMLEHINPESLIVYPAQNKDTGRVINIFLDTDCPFCRAQHREIPALTQAGVTVRYLAQVLDNKKSTQSKERQILQKIWCHPDRQLALKSFMQQTPIFTHQCASNHVSAHSALANSLQLKGSPSLILDDGQLLTGYRNAKDILEHLNISKTAQ